MITQARNDIIGCSDFLPVNRLAQHFKMRPEILAPALVEWSLENRIFSIEHEDCSLFPRYAFSTQTGLSPIPELKDTLTILSPTKDGWLMAYWFLTPNTMLGGKRPQDLVSTDPIRVALAAQEEVDGVLHG